MDAQEELAFLRSVAASQLQTIKALTLGCEKYGLTETTPVVRHLAAQDDEIERLRAELAEYKRDAERYRAVRYANVHNIDPDYQGVMNDEMPVFEQMEDLDKVVDGLKVKVDAALAAKEE